MNTVSVKQCQSDEGIILTKFPHITKLILNNLDNSDLFKCKQVCSSWRMIADEILSRRITIINRKIPYMMKRKAVTEPESVACLDIQRYLNVPFLVEFNLDYVIHRDLGRRSLYSQSEESTYNMDRHKRDMEKVTPTNYQISTQIAIFPKLPGINVKRFLFSSDHMHLSNEERITHLTELINVPKEELKCILWFINDLVHDLENYVPDFGIPSVVLSTSENFFCYDPSKYCGISFFGKRMNAVMLKITECSSFDETESKFRKKVRSKFRKEIQKVKDYKLEPFRCLALMCVNDSCPKEMQNDILFLFKETFPKLPVLTFSEMRLLDVPVPEENRDDDWLPFYCYFNMRAEIAVIRIILLLLN